MTLILTSANKLNMNAIFSTSTTKLFVSRTKRFHSFRIILNVPTDRGKVKAIQGANQQRKMH